MTSSGRGWKGCCGPLGWVALNAVLWFGGGASTVYLATRPEPAELESSQRERMEKGLEGLDLSAEQREEIDEILKEFEGRVVGARGTFWDEVRAIESWADAELREVLSEEQEERLPGTSEGPGD